MRFKPKERFLLERSHAVSPDICIVSTLVFGGGAMSSPLDRSRSNRPAPRVIRSGDVRYPSMGGQAGDQAGYASSRTGRLKPARDAGISLDSRLGRERRRRERVRRERTVILVGLLLLAAAIVIGMKAKPDKQVAAAVPAPAPTRTTAPREQMAAIRANTRPPEPTPLIARYGSIKLRLPVALDALTEVGYHQASYSYALPLKSLVADAPSMKKVKAEQGTHRDPSKQEEGLEAVLTGSVLRMWRNRPGNPDTAADVGAKPGSAILSPVDGTVVLVKSYKLYGKHDDWELHIQPQGHPELDLVLIHCEDPKVKAGDKVIGGVTRLGSIRMLSDRENLQLADYTKSTGDHVHFQLNDATDSQYKGLRGAIKVTD